MNQIKLENLKDTLVRVIDTYSPEYISQSEESETYFFSLIDSIERFEDECEESTRLENEKEETLEIMQGKNLLGSA